MGEYEKILNFFIVFYNDHYKDHKIFIEEEKNNGMGYVSLKFSQDKLAGLRQDYDERRLPDEYRNGREESFKKIIHATMLLGLHNLKETKLK